MKGFFTFAGVILAFFGIAGIGLENYHMFQAGADWLAFVKYTPNLLVLALIFLGIASKIKD